MAFGPALFAVGAGLSFFGRLQASREEARQLKNKSILLGKTSQEILELNELNTKFIKEEVDKTQGQAITKSAQSGFATDINALSDIALAGAREIELRTMEAEREASMRNLEASMYAKNARNTRKAGVISAVGSILGNAGRLI